jgi:hypothetical protein
MNTSAARRIAVACLAFVAVATLAVSCGKSDSDGGSGGTGRSSSGAHNTPDTALKVPSQYKTIQKAVDAAKPGDLVLVSPGIYKEAVDVQTADITIRGTDRNKVILEGNFKLENGVRVLGTDGVVVENMTARDYLSNGFYWTGSDRYRGSYLTAYRNGDYGIYAFDAYHGQFDHSLGQGSPDAGFYIGECYKCDAVIDHVKAEYNGLGYSGTNSGGDLYIVNSEFSNNRAGIVPNAGSYEGCYPGRDGTYVGNIVHDNNYLDGGGIDSSLLAQGNGILLAGSINNTVERNLVYNHKRTGIAAVPFPEDDANDTPPPASELSKPCDPTKKPSKKKVGTVLWNATGNHFVGNVIENSGLADIGSGTIPDDNKSLKALNNCFSDNTFKTSAPSDLEKLAPCTGAGNGGDFSKGSLDLIPLIADKPPVPSRSAYRSTPIPGDQDNMPGATSQAAEKFTGPKKPDIAAIKVPKKPS